MKEHIVYEVERSDWELLEDMTIAEAKEVIDDRLSDYLGDYNRGSSDLYHYNKARLYTAIRKILNEVE